MPQYPGVDELGPGVDGAQSQAQWVPMCWPPQGMDLTISPNNIPQGRPEVVLNFIPYPDSWRQRPGLAYVGSPTTTTDTLIYAKQVVDATGVEWIIRWSTTGVSCMVGLAWTACTGPALTLNAYSKITVTGWGNVLLFSDGESGTYVLDMQAGTYSLVTNAPAAIHLTTFNRRIIASVPNSSRVQWCVAGDYTDWTSTNLGAGYEDLLSAPGGSVDRQTAVLPLSDEIAYCVRSNSVWQMEPTRNLDAPFAFSRVVSDVGSRWAPTCTTVPGGIAFMGDRGVFLMRGGNVEDLTPTIRSLFATATQQVLRSCWMIYDGEEECLRLLGGFTDSRFNTSPTTHLVLRWNFRIGGGWSADRYPVIPVSLASAIDFRKRGTIGELTGTIGALTGVIGDLGVSRYSSGVVFAVNVTGNSYVARENPAVAADLDSSTSTQAMLRSTAVRQADPSRTVSVLGVWAAISEPDYVLASLPSGSNDLVSFSLQTVTPEEGNGSGGTASVDHTVDSLNHERCLWPLVATAYAPIVRLLLTIGPYFRLYIHDLRVRVVDGAFAGGEGN